MRYSIVLILLFALQPTFAKAGYVSRATTHCCVSAVSFSVHIANNNEEETALKQIKIQVEQGTKRPYVFLFTPAAEFTAPNKFTAYSFNYPSYSCHLSFDRLLLFPKHSFW